MSSRIILLKTKSSPADPYETTITSKTSLQPVFIPILQHTKVNHDKLLDLCQKTPHKQFDGIIITSQRTVETLSEVMRQLNRSPQFHFISNRNK